ncbi:MAG: S8/S53 family peptidase [Bacteroidia bacterium]
MKTFLFKIFFQILAINVFTFSLNAQDVKNLRPALKSYYQSNVELAKKSAEPIMVDFIVKAKSPEAKNVLESVGSKIKYTKGDLIAVRIPLDKIPEIAQSKHIYPLEFSIEKGLELNDTMRLRNRVDEVHLGIAPLDMPYDGEGVVVGFIDTGIDYTHPDFQNPDGSTRVLAIWDQSKPYDATFTPLKYGYGQEWDSVEINAGISTHDLNGTHHGSTVSGAAAGNALASGYNKGVAPKADIVMVKSDFTLPNWFMTVADAVDYIFGIADAHGKPCVINASVGGYLGSHDGTDAAALMIDQLTAEKSGRLFVCAAGNSGTKGAYHLRNDVNSDTTFTWFTINPSSAFGGIVAGYADVWAYKTEFDDVYFAIGADKNSPNFEFRGRTAFHNLILDDMVDKMTPDSIVVDGNKLADIEYYVTEDNGSYEIEIYMPEPDSSQYYYRLITTTQTSGRYDLWADSFLGISDIVSTGLPTVGDFPDMQYYVMPDTLQTIVTSWACSPNTITVANYVNTDRFIDYNGDTQIPAGAFVNYPKQLKQHSSKGPTRNGNIKPDIAATGDITMSPGIVSDVINRRTANPTQLHLSGWHVSNGGTSMASPVVAGVGALLLQSCPELTPQAFKDLITSTTYSDEFTGATLPNYAWGYGKVDAHAAVSATIISKPTISEFGNILTSTAANAYQWYKDGVEITGETSQTYNATESGQYVVEVFNQYGCSKFSDAFDFILGLNLNSNKVILYPNPFNNELYIQFDTLLDDIDVQISDVIGRNVFSSKIEKNKTQINLSYLESGVYFVVVRSNEQELTKATFVKK